MKVTFEFDLPDEQHEYDVMNQASKMQRFLQEFSENLRVWQKYAYQFKDANHVVEQIRGEFYFLLKDYEVNIDL
jgi:hypothetical protein